MLPAILAAVIPPILPSVPVSIFPAVPAAVVASVVPALMAILPVPSPVIVGPGLGDAALGQQGEEQGGTEEALQHGV
jgi:hypothetical protein